MNSCVNSPEDGPVGPKHVEIRQYINKIEIVTSVGFYSICSGFNSRADSESKTHIHMGPIHNGSGVMSF